MERKNMNAEGILMHRSKNIIALRATQGTKTVIQVFNLDTKGKLKTCEVNENDGQLDLITNRSCRTHNL